MLGAALRFSGHTHYVRTLGGCSRQTLGTDLLSSCQSTRVAFTNSTANDKQHNGQAYEKPSALLEMVSTMQTRSAK